MIAYLSVYVKVRDVNSEAAGESPFDLE